ncbi:MAG: restriction endonuclease subunit S [Candidatus Moeniiplasma glomeromycotorum]|nr:restriction endonuclease subunit S [Candidatus Moeniiplasma glomeromycotorum]MCE8162316.1 restriction endonuclease subunit S [Candidatus Moeniiplasma glomeromycotorum]MCE8166240.1 restriction endonuclease subunit S [Candidatus Moeniiplasma glomeromycotorum]MCE8166722.1 restriction endonuclease subunit S [Candidatus Moeniiplasma glomeromycotorum]
MEKGKIYKLGEICEIRSGKTPDTRNKEYWCSHEQSCTCVPFITVSDITQQNLKAEKKLTLFAINENKIALTTNNSVLYSKVRYIQPFYPGQGIAYNHGVFCLEIRDENLILPNYLYYWLLSQKSNLYSLRGSSAYPILLKGEFENFSVFLPSLQEQNQILQKFQIVYNQLFQSEVIYNDFLLKMIQKYLELGDLLFLKYQDSQIKIKDHFKLIAGKSPYASLYKNNKELYELIEKKSRQLGIIKWVNSGVLTNCYFLTNTLTPSKLIDKELVSLCKLNYGINNSVLIPGVYFDIEKITWNQTNNYIIGQEILNLDYLKDENRFIQNATLFFALRSQASKITDNCCHGSTIKNLDFQSFKNYDLNWVSDPTHQKIFFTILNSKLAKIKDLHRKIKDLLLLKYFGKK